MNKLLLIGAGLLGAYLLSDTKEDKKEEKNLLTDDKKGSKKESEAKTVPTEEKNQDV